MFQSLPNPKSRSPIAVFDFDGTLTQRDSLLPFLREVAGNFQYRRGILVNSPMLMKYVLGQIPNWQAKQELLTYFLRDWPEIQLNQIAEKFALEEIPRMLRPQAIQRVKWHQQQGHKLILLSASLEAYLWPWAKSIGFDYVLGTRLEVQSGIFTGRILGKNCYGIEKVERLKTFLGDLSQYSLYAYGDSKGDKELLSVATYPYYRRFNDPKTKQINC